MYRVRTAITGGPGGAELSTHYFSVVGGLTAANANAAVGAFWNAIKLYIHPSFTFTTEGEVAEVDIATGQVTGAQAVTPIAVVGTAGGDLLPSATQGLVRWRTGTFVGGREVRGRTFIPGATETWSASGVPLTTYTTALNTAAAALISDANSDFQIYSRKHRDAVPAITGAAWNQWAVLRSRRL